jgi:diguanylate cyclase (GGDEF)-like protein
VSDFGAIADTAIAQSLATLGVDAARIELQRTTGEPGTVDRSKGLSPEELARDTAAVVGRAPGHPPMEELELQPTGPGDLAGAVVLRFDADGGSVRGRFAVFWRADGVPPDPRSLEELAALRDAVCSAISRSANLVSLGPPTTLDRLTGLRSRQAFEADVVREVARAKRHDLELAVLLIDLDGFRDLNAGLGRAGADAVLAEVGGRLAISVRSSDEVARMGGDRFALVLPNSDTTGAIGVFRRLAARLREGEGLTSVRVAASGGTAAFGGETADVLLGRATDALRLAKREHRGDIAVWNASREG